MIERTYCSGARSVTAGESVEHRHRRRRQHGRADLEASDQFGEDLGLEAVHDHERSAGPEAEQDVVDARR